MSGWRFLGAALNTDKKARRAAREFAEMIGAVVNATVSHAPISFVEVDGKEPTWFIAHLGANRLPAALPLVNGHHLYVYNLLGLRRRERYLATLEYRYTYQATADDDSWIFRYEHVREPPSDYAYAHSHVHVNGTPGPYLGDKPFPGLHLPTGKRITIELLVRHLITEHAIAPISPRWEEVVVEGEAHFREVQRKRLQPE